MAGPLTPPSIRGIIDLELIGRGGFSAVFRGVQPAFRRSVAVKVLTTEGLDDEDRLRFDRECQAMGALSDHPGIVTIYGAGYTEDARPYMVMAYVAGGTLLDRIAGGTPMPWDELATSGVQLCGALETAHRVGVLHRDVKPGNVLRSPYSDQLADFGIARVAGGHETVSGVITTSIAHAPPEVLDGEAPTPRADVYSLGSTLHNCLTGATAFGGNTGGGLGPLIKRVMTDPPPGLSPYGIPPELAEVVATAMEEDPSNRFASAAEMGEALRSAQATLGASVTDLVITGVAPTPTHSPGAAVAAGPDMTRRAPTDAPERHGSEGSNGDTTDGFQRATLGPEDVTGDVPTVPHGRSSRRNMILGASAVVLALAAAGLWAARGPSSTSEPSTTVDGSSPPVTSDGAPPTSTNTTVPPDAGPGAAAALVLPPGDPVELKLMHLGFSVINSSR